MISKQIEGNTKRVKEANFNYLEFMSKFGFEVIKEDIINFRERLFSSEREHFDQLSEDRKNGIIIIDKVIKKEGEEKVVRELIKLENKLPGLREIKENMDEYLQTNIHTLNNFYAKFPGGFQRMEKYQQASGNKTLREFLEGKDAKHLNDYSEKRLNQTRQEFFKTIDDAVLECGLNLEEIKNENEQIVKPSQTQSLGVLDEMSKKRAELLKKLIPVYYKLIEWGYVKKELTG